MPIAIYVYTCYNINREREEDNPKTSERIDIMKEITIQEAISMPYLIIDMFNSVKDYEKYDFHRGMRCKINGYTFELMAYNGELSLEAEAIVLSAHGYKKEKSLPFFKCGETIAIIEVFNGFAKAYEITLPQKVRHQSFLIK